MCGIGRASEGDRGLSADRFVGRKVEAEVRRFATTTPGLMALSAWLEEAKVTHVAMEATGVYWKPVWHILEAGSR